MKSKMILTLLCVVTMTGAVCAGTYTRTYGWEDAGVTILGQWPANSVTATNVTSPYVFAGNRSLQLQRTSSDTPQAQLIWIDGLVHGDVVKAGFWVYDDTPNASPSGRIWANYTRGSQIYAGSAGGPDDYSGPDWPGDGNDWWFLQAEWTFDVGDLTKYDPREGMQIQARIYPNGGIIWVDDAYVTVPDHATVHFGQVGNGGVPADFPDFPDALSCDWRWSDIAGRDPETSDTVWNRRNFLGNCQVGIEDLQAFAAQWLTDANVDVYTDPNYTTPNAHDHYIYDWEDAALISEPERALVWVNPFHASGNGPFNSFNYASAQLTDAGLGYPNTGRAIACYDNGGSQTGELYVAWIKNLQHGDKVSASVYLKDPDDGRGSVRLWASYARTLGIYAGGTNHGDIDFSSQRFAQPFDNGWARHSAEWVFDEGDPQRDQMIITIRTYTTDDSFGQRLAGWADNLVVSVPDYAEVVFPTQASLNTDVIGPEGELWVGTGNLVPGFQDLICTVRPYADLDHDCRVTLNDFAYMAGEWLTCGFSDQSECWQ